VTHRLAWTFLALAGLAGCARRPEAPAGPPAQILRISQINEPATLDPALAALPDDFFVIRALSEGLVTPGPDGAPAQPAAADQWEAEPDGVTWVFHLHPGARWSNGEPVTAADFVDSYRRVLTPGTAAPKANLLFMVKNARDYASGRLTDFSTVGFLAPDPLTLVVTLEQPMPQFLDYVASGPWIPVNPRVVERFGRRWTQAGSYVGNGPFVLVQWMSDQRIVVRRNPLYHRPVPLDEIQFIRCDDRDSEERAYRAGEIDVTMTVPMDKLDAYVRERPAELRRAPLAETRFLCFNLNRPPLDDLRVRRALSLSLDRSQLARDVLRGGQQPAFRLLPPGIRLPGDMASDLTGNLFSVDSAEAQGDRTTASRNDEARRLLAEAGFPGGRGFPRLVLAGWSHTPILEAVQDMWLKNLGIRVAIDVLEARVYEEALRTGQFDIGFMTLIPDVADPLAALGRFATDAVDNYAHWSDPEFDSELAEAARQTDPALEAADLRKAETRLLDAQPIAPLYFNARNWLMRPEVKGWQEDQILTRNYLGVSIGR
jgi:oligopeptide transport system substrate-binding protein